jgi:hypothetical protein
LTENHGIIGYGNMGKPFAKTPWVWSEVLCYDIWWIM